MCGRKIHLKLYTAVYYCGYNNCVVVLFYHGIPSKWSLWLDRCKSSRPAAHRRTEEHSLSLMQNNRFLFAVGRKARRKSVNHENGRRKCTGNLNFNAYCRSLNEQNETEIKTWVFVSKQFRDMFVFVLIFFCKETIKMEDKNSSR